GVCSTRNVDMVRTIGADRVIDYTQEDFTKSDQRYDLLFDCVGNHSLSACRRVLNPRGALVIVGAPGNARLSSVLAHVVGALVLSRFVSQNLVPFIAKSNSEDLTIVRDLMAAGKVTPVIDRCYPLREAPEAFRYMEDGHARGKVILTVEDNNRT